MCTLYSEIIGQWTITEVVIDHLILVTLFFVNNLLKLNILLGYEFDRTLWNHLCKGVANWRSELYLSALCVQIEQQKNRLFMISQHVFTACLSSTTYIYYGYNKIKFCMFQSQGERFAEKHLQFQTFALLNIHKLTKTYEAKHVFIFNWNR
ncbi:unnamed protein product [Tenebrio molitor]|jgi:hypothetical protein|nr:unnamed protein product [Tenebrio molitor]